MSTVVLHYATASGVILRVLHSEELQLRFPSLAAGESAFSFDGDTNAATLREMRDELALFKMVAGTLRKNGNVVAINADSQAAQDIDSLIGAAANAIATNEMFLAMTSPSNAQTLAQVRALTQQANRIIRRLVILGRK